LFGPQVPGQQLSDVPSSQPACSQQSLSLAWSQPLEQHPSAPSLLHPVFSQQS
jgi:hypothetical protein